MKMLLLAGALLLAAGPAFAQPAKGKLPSRAEDLFEYVDTDHDGRVILSEFKAMLSWRVDHLFDYVDTNHDGEITKAEMEAARVRAESRSGGAARQTQDGGAFWRLDGNGDGLISRAEAAAGAERRFNAADTNHDGWLSKGELLAMRLWS